MPVHSALFGMAKMMNAEQVDENKHSFQREGAVLHYTGIIFTFLLYAMIRN